MSGEEGEAERLRVATGRRIRAAREAQGLSSRNLAERMGVDASAVVAWEAGRYLPKGVRRTQLARLLDTAAGALFGEADGRDAPRSNGSGLNGAAGEPSARLTHTHDDLPGLLVDSVSRARVLRAFRFAAPYTQPAHVQVGFRNAVAQRLLAGELKVQRAEIVYSLDRLKELLHNIFLYDGKMYEVKAYCAGLTEVAPAMGGYIFDDELALLGAYWTSIPPLDWPGLALAGEPFSTFFKAYWDEIWRRGAFLNIRGAHDLTAARELALALGLSPADWPAFVEAARRNQISDGAPPPI